MDNPETEREEIAALGDGIEKLERDIKDAVEHAKGSCIKEIELKIFFDRLMGFAKYLSNYIKQYKKDEMVAAASEEARSCLKQANQYMKHIIFWNFLALFLFWAGINIDAQQKSGAIFGIAISGLDKNEIIVAFVGFMLILYTRLMWIMSKILIIIEANEIVFNAKKTIDNYERVRKLLVSYDKAGIAKLYVDNIPLKRQLNLAVPVKFYGGYLIGVIECALLMATSGIMLYTLWVATNHVGQYYGLSLIEKVIFIVLPFLAVHCMPVMFLWSVKWIKLRNLA